MNKHYFYLNWTTHPLEIVTSPDILLDILKDSRTKLAKMEDLVGYPCIYNIPPARFIVGFFEDVEHLILPDTSGNNHVRNNLKEISLV
jgi:hypothetical protein